MAVTKVDLKIAIVTGVVFAVATLIMRHWATSIQRKA